MKTDEGKGNTKKERKDKKIENKRQNNFFLILKCIDG